MKHFARDLVIAMCPGSSGRQWRLKEHFWWETPAGVRIDLHPGFETDGASVPRALWRLVGPPWAARYAPAAVVHDVLYASELVPRKVADCLFREAMGQLGVSWWRRSVMYRAVRMGGAAVWRKHTPESVALARRFISTSASPALLEMCVE